MRKVLSTVGLSLVAIVLLALLALRVVGLDPKERRAGLWLTGEVVTTPVADWSFTDQYQTIYLQTRSWYLLPHSVTVTCMVSGGQLYLTSTLPPGGQFPQDKLWNRNVVRDPRVRLKIGTRVYDRTLTLVTDQAEKDAVLQSKGKKYPRLRNVDPARIWVLRVSAS